ncbi:hypothetical protein MWW42_000286 [Vibrio alginolyticus]|nr:hypothetical protein [Vibrio alginolyticus]
MLIKETNNDEPESLDQHLQRLSELSVQALEELAEMIEVRDDIPEE